MYHGLRRITELCVMAFRAVTRFSSLPWRNGLRLLGNNSFPLRNYSNGDNGPQDATDIQPENVQPIFSELYRGISASPFPSEVAQKLDTPLNPGDIEIKSDGLIYLPEIKYRRILNQAFGPGGWALMPYGEVSHLQSEGDGAQMVTREYMLYCHGRFVAQAMGEHTYYSRNSLQYGKACEAAKSNALMRCCKDLGIASALWDPQFVEQWKREHAEEVWCENVRTKEKKKLWRKKTSTQSFPYPWKENKL